MLNREKEINNPWNVEARQMSTRIQFESNVK